MISVFEFKSVILFWSYKMHRISKSLNLIQKAWYSCLTKNTKSQYRCNLSRPSLLIQLPTEILSKIILELLNEWSLTRTLKITYLRGHIDLYENLPELSTHRMIPLSQVNTLFYELVWSIALKYSYWDEKVELPKKHVQGKAMIRREPFVFSQNMLKPRGIEPVNKFYITGPLSQKRLRFVQNLMMDKVPFLFTSVGKGLQRSITYPKLQYLTRLRITTDFVYETADKYKAIERRFPKYWQENHCRFKQKDADIPPFYEAGLRQQTTDKLAIETKIHIYYEILICTAVAKMVSQQDHLVKCTIFNGTCFGGLHTLLWCFAKENIISQVDTLQLYISSKSKICNVCAELFELLNLDHLNLIHNQHGLVTQELATLLIENNPGLRVLYCDDSNVTYINFSRNLELLKVGSRPFFWSLKIPLSQQFPRLIELYLNFQAHIDEKYINGKLMHLPTLKTLRVSGVVYMNTKLICCLLESNPTVTVFSIYTKDPYELLESLYRNMSHIKLLDISYQNLWQEVHYRELDIESLLDVILTNASSLEMVMIHKSLETNPILFRKLATKLTSEYEGNTKYLRYLYIFTDNRNQNELDVQTPASNFFADLEHDTSQLSPYNPDVKQTYRIDCVMFKNEMDTKRCRLEIDVRGIQKLVESHQVNSAQSKRVSTTTVSAENASR